MREQMERGWSVGRRGQRCLGGLAAGKALGVALLAGAVLLCLAGAGRSLAAMPSPTVSVADSATTIPLPATDATTYQLGAGDVLRVSVFGHDELTLELTVRPDGRISYPLAGDLVVAGQTTSQVAERIQQALQAYIRDPQVTVMVTQFRQVRVQVSGEVARPGLYVLPVGTRVLDALGQAGGWTRQAAVSRLLLIRGGQAERLDLRPAIEEGQADKNIPLTDGDILYLPPGATAVIWGEVRSPGAYTLAEKTSLIQLLAVAGGALPSANLEAVQVSRVDETGRPQRTVLRADQVQQWQIQPDDVVYVPAVQGVTVLGAVAKPGRYPLVDGGTRLWDALAQAGGTTATAATDRVTVTRAGVSGSPTSVTLDLSSPADGGVPAAGAYALQANDLVYVPEGRQEVVVLGQVQRPGVVPWRSGMRLLDVLAAVGGATDQAASERAVLAHAQNGQSTVVDLTSLSQTAGSTQNLLVQPGDTLFVPAGRPQVAVLGEVARPGVYPLTPGLRLIDVVAAAGGVTAQARQGQALLTRTDPQTGEPGHPTWVNLFPTSQAAAAGSGTWSGGALAQAGDVLYVPAALQTATVLGEVHRPGQYPVEPGWRILDLLAAAGGPTEAADLGNVTYARTALATPDGATTSAPGQPPADRSLTATGATGESDSTQDAAVAALDLSRLQATPHSPDNRLVHPGDVLVVNRNEQWVSTLGEWLKPVTLPWRRGLTLGDLVTQAGGPTARADMAHVTLIRQEAGVLSYQTVSLMKWLGKSDENTTDGLASGSAANTKAEANPALAGPEIDAGFLLQPGDVFLARELPVTEVVVLGEVQRPGVVAWRPDLRLLDVLGAVGGLTDQAGGDRAILARAKTGETVTVDLTTLPQSASAPQNPLLQPGDTLFVPTAYRQATVLGEVARPGVYPLTPGLRLVDLVAAAGGPTSQADLTHVTYSQVVGPAAKAAGTGGALAAAGTKVETLDLSRVEASPRSPANRLVQPGDVLVIARNEEWVSTLGEWVKPTTLPWRPGLTLGELVTQAGGPTPQADLAYVTLIRRGPAGLAYQSLNLVGWLGSAQKMAAAGGTGGSQAAGVDAAFPLQPGDVLVARPLAPVVVLGQVARPGAYSVASGQGLMQVLAMAGGVTPSGDSSQIVWTQPGKGGQSVVVDLTSRPDATGMAAADARGVAPGDVIFVPENHRTVLVLGEVRTPQQVAVWPGMRLLEALARAGGPTAAADLHQALLSQAGQVRTIDLAAILDNPLSPENVLLKGDEALILPKRLQAIAVLGAVEHPGSYTLEEPATLVAAVAAAGGLLDSADLTAATLTRTLPDGQRSTERVDLAAAQASPASTSNVTVSGGDVLFVPEQERRVLVYGAVRSPGAYVVKPGARVLDALGMAGGPTEQADLAALTLTRMPSGTATLNPGQQVIDLAALLRRPQDPANQVLVAGDVLYLPAARQMAILGQVVRPGMYTLPAGSRLLDLVALAGGLTDRADNGFTVLRLPLGQTEPQVLAADYQAILGNAQPGQNLVLQPGDVVYVPEGRKQVLVLGQVRNPGLYTVRPGMTVLDVIGLAGGPSERAKLDAVGIYRGGQAGPATVQLGKDKVVFQGNVTENPPVQGGDLIYVPETSKPDWNAIFGFLGGVKLFKDLLGIQIQW